MKPIVIFITAKNKKEARHIALGLLKKKLVACVNIVGAIESFFWWQGKVDRTKEALLIIKSEETKLTKIIKLVKSLHSYDIPEIIALPIDCGYKPYLRWLGESIR